MGRSLPLLSVILKGLTISEPFRGPVPLLPFLEQLLVPYDFSCVSAFHAAALVWYVRPIQPRKRHRVAVDARTAEMRVFRLGPFNARDPRKASPFSPPKAATVSLLPSTSNSRRCVVSMMSVLPTPSFPMWEFTHRFIRARSLCDVNANSPANILTAIPPMKFASRIGSVC